MYVERLFLGFCLDASMEQRLAALDPKIRKLFFSGGDYLQEWNDGIQKYLGKVTDSVAALPMLDLLESNILSLKQRLLPNPDSADAVPELCLLAILQTESQDNANV